MQPLKMQFISEWIFTSLLREGMRKIALESKAERIISISIWKIHAKLFNSIKSKIYFLKILNDFE